MSNKILNRTKSGFCRWLYTVFITVSMLVVMPGTANAIIDDNAEVVTVRQDCGLADNCFTDINVMSDWIHNTRLPSASLPLFVDVGPGPFNGFYCTEQGNITVRGSGRENTVLLGALGGPLKNRVNGTAVNISDCTNLTFENLSIRGTITGITWSGSGNSTYNNVEISVNGGTNTSFAWYDSCSAGVERSVHNFFGSSIIAEGAFYNFAYYTDCAETWIYGSEITAKGKSGSSSLLANKAFRLVGDNAEVQVFGSLVRSVAGSATAVNATVGAAQGLAAVSVQDGGTFHMHGGILTAKAKGASGDVDVASVSSTGNSNIHVLGTAFNPVAAGNGTAYRILTDGNGNVRSPFLWAAGDSVPEGNPNGDSIQSVNGADIFVETDCYADGDCDTAGGTETHMMIYNAACNTASNWFDSTTGRCRGVTN